MSNQEKKQPLHKKRPAKINVDQSSKPTEYKRAVKLFEHKGLEIAVPEAEQFDIFEAVSVALGAPRTKGRSLFNWCYASLKKWFDTKTFPKRFDFLAEIKPFSDFYCAFPNHVLFEGVS